MLDNIDLDIGVHIINSCGHGILKPNIILIGYKHGWFHCTDDDIQTYLNIIKYTFIHVIKKYLLKKSIFIKKFIKYGWNRNYNCSVTHERHNH